MSFDPQHFVCAVDFSSHSVGLLHWARHLARIFNARLSVFHAVTRSHDYFSGTAIFERGGRQEDLLAVARQRLEDLTAPLENAEAIVAVGDPVETLSEYARKTAAGLVVAARRGFSGIQRIMLGSVVERMARRLAQPLMVVGPTEAGEHRHAFNKVVVACDAAGTRAPTLIAAAALARAFGADLHLLHAMELPVKAEMLEPTDGPYGEVQAALQHRLHQEMSRRVQAVAADLNVSVNLAPGPATEVLPRYIMQQQADLLVVGVRPRRRLEQMLIGSTTEAALRHASCAVMTVPAAMN